MFLNNLELCRLRSRSAAHLEQELDLLRRGASSDGAKGAGGEKEEWSLLSLYRNENLRWPFICSIVMHIGNQLSGINAVKSRARAVSFDSFGTAHYS